MCGIAGIVRSFGPQVEKRELKIMTDKIAHRGPDGEGQWVSEDGKVGLGHRRLSIIDLSEAGSQPMHYRGRYSIVFNGEIYNYLELKDRLHTSGYRFENNTDTEVVMAAYDEKGKDCLKDFDGMFAFVIYDHQKREIFCARDRFGEKPFYYHFDGKSFVFASEMKALWAVGVKREFNEYAVYNYIVNNRAVGEKKSDTFYEDIYQLKPSHSITILIDDLEIQQECYWKINAEQKEISTGEAIEKFSYLFNQSINRRLRSDVPIGSSLSGGLDSSMVVGYISKIGKAKQQNTFSAAFPGFARDESSFQEMMANYAKTNHFITSPNMEKNLENFDTILYHQEEPFGSMSVTLGYEVFKLAKSNGVSVLLDGQGADEILAGYSYFTFSFLKELLSQGHPFSFLSTAFEASKKQSKSAFYFLGGALSEYAPNQLLNRFKSNNTDEAKALLNPDFADKFKHLKHKDLEIPSTLNEALDKRTNDFGLDQLLRYYDRNAMAHSLEVRLPFLNHDFVEFIFSLPSELKINKGWTKWVARKAAQRYVPEEIIWRREKVAYESTDNFLDNYRMHPSIHSIVSSDISGEYFKTESKIKNSKLFFRKVMIDKLIKSIG